MSWSAPVPGIPTQIITAAWSQANVVDLLNWLRLMTGNADPPAGGYTIMSLSPTQTVWGKLTSDYINAGAILDSHLADPKVSKALTNYANLAQAAAAGSGYSSSFQSGGNVDGPVASDWFVQTLNVGTRQVQTITSIYDEALTYIRLVVAGTPTSWKQVFHSGNDARAGVPSGLIAAFQSAGTIAAGWARFTNLDGRIPVGAGTTFGQTFVEGASAGSSWAHLHAVAITSQNNNPGSGSVNSGSGSTSVPTHTHDVTGNTANTTWIPPSFAVVWAQKA